MSSSISNLLSRKVRSAYKRLNYFLAEKSSSEIDFWIKERAEIMRWASSSYEHYGSLLPPTLSVPKDHPDLLPLSLQLWLDHFQKPKYLSDLGLNSFDLNGTVLDIGSGPFPSAHVFDNCQVINVDPLFNQYRSIGYLFLPSTLSI